MSQVYAVENRVVAYLSWSGTMGDMEGLHAMCDSYAADMSRLLDELRSRVEDAWCW